MKTQPKSPQYRISLDKCQNNKCRCQHRPGSFCFFYLRFHFFRSQDFSPLSLFIGFCSFILQNPVNFQLIIIQLFITEVAQLLSEEPLMHLLQTLLLLMQNEHFSGSHQIIMNNPVRKDVLFHSQ